ncbi:hypothetical protein C7S18_21315 [Ahniella affigens]|uniref:Uncharacterized protein n=1 Tax=Ahniella affigens TaxID=2021234 RepID=A0A2P1PXI6_9GAMM|nr:hypothetical protein C7S18_21315 [Ahniella affigens]
MRSASFYRWRSQPGAASEEATRLPVASMMKRGEAGTEFVELGRRDVSSSHFELRQHLGCELLLSLTRD